MPEVIAFKGTKQAPKSLRSKMDTLCITQETVKEWTVPQGVQRPLKVNSKVLALSESLKQDGGVIPNVITLGKVDGDRHTYIVDGQHRIEAFKLSELKEGFVDVRIVQFDTMAELAQEFVVSQASLVRMSPDDVLRAMENFTPSIQYIRRECPFVGYSNVRRGDQKSPVLSMSATIRCWVGSAGETPSTTSNGKGAEQMAKELSEDDSRNLVVFLSAARAAWGADPEYYRLWSNLNMCMSMWLWRTLVMDKQRTTKRYVVLTPEQFKRCLMSVSAHKDYIDWLLARQMGERDRSPCYRHLRNIFAARLREETPGNKQPTLPQPAWWGRS
jgi:hypothetical protein